MTKFSDVLFFALVVTVILGLVWLFSAPSSDVLGNTGIISKPSGSGSAGSDSSPLSFYSDFSGTTPVSEINWETLSPSQSKDSTIYVRNSGLRDLTLTFSTDSWSPANASNYMTLSWDAPQSLSVQAGEIKPIIFTLTVTSNITGITEFSFNIVIWYD